MRKTMTIAQMVWLEVLRRKDAYVLLILMGSLLFILVGLNIFGVGQLVRYVKDVGLMSAWLFSWIMAIAISTRIIPQEEKSGTIFPLLAKPVSRFEFILGKWIGAWSIASLATLCFYLLITLVVHFKGGLFSFAAIAQGLFLHCMALGIITAIGILFSVKMNSDAAASMSFVLSAASFTIAPRVSELVAKSSGLHARLLDVIYHILPHFEILDMRRRIVHNYGPVSTKTFLCAITYALCLSLAIALLAWIAYRKKHFSRSDIYG